MKKIKSLLLVAVCSMAFVACGNSIDRKLDQLEKACKNEDQIKAAQICTELEQKEKEFTPEQKERFKTIVLDYISK
jgi:hypothetical protein